jgi:hypothetical protein
MGKTSYRCSLLLVVALAVHIQLTSASSEDSNYQARLEAAQQKACTLFCNGQQIGNGQITDAVTQRACIPVCSKIILLETRKSETVRAAAAASAAEEDPFVSLGVAPASLCPGFCKEINATSTEDCETSCVTSSSTLSAGNIETAPSVSGSLQMTLSLFSTCVALFMALF